MVYINIKHRNKLEMTDMSLGGRLKELRNKQSLTQQELAQKIG